MTTTTIPEGSLARLTRDLTESWADGVKQKGQTFEVGEFYSAGDPAEDEIDVDFYYGNVDGGGNNVCVPADAVEVVKTAEQMRARSIPTLAALLDFIGDGLLGDGDGFEVTETDQGKRSIEAYGHTDDGLPFAFEIKVVSLYQAD